MKKSRRIARMTRYKRGAPQLNLTSMMDVFTILVFFLIFNSSATSELVQNPKHITLPDSVVEAKPRETVVIIVGMDEVLVQGEPMARIADIRAHESAVEPIRARLAELSESVIGLNTQAIAESQEVTVLADKAVPFGVLKRIMATCTGEGYTRVSLAVIQKPQST